MTFSSMVRYIDFLRKLFDTITVTVIDEDDPVEIKAKRDADDSDAAVDASERADLASKKAQVRNPHSLFQL